MRNAIENNLQCADTIAVVKMDRKMLALPAKKTRSKIETTTIKIMTKTFLKKNFDFLGTADGIKQFGMKISSERIRDTMVGYVVLVSLCLPFATTQDLTDEHCDTCRIKRATRSQLADIKVRLYTGEDLDTYTEVVVGDATELLDKMNLSKPTVLLIHGLYGTLSRLYNDKIILGMFEG
ncbi:uncharacterized protein LOC124416302 [Diprion similis]|uniref:uncharacterized protein LOC124416302 n=1 Tax=Diprion similis TaxID=362088 RepID=UPI001EF974E1|nr:uncharacterized protein LOC124416302 [Diprion similis]